MPTCTRLALHLKEHNKQCFHQSYYRYPCTAQDSSTLSIITLLRSVCFVPIVLIASWVDWWQILYRGRIIRENDISADVFGLSQSGIISTSDKSWYPFEYLTSPFFPILFHPSYCGSSLIFECLSCNGPIQIIDVALDISLLKK